VGTQIGPHAHLRAEVIYTAVWGICRENSKLGPKRILLTLVLGKRYSSDHVNIGRGTITANYDGVYKHPTQQAIAPKTGYYTLVAPFNPALSVATWPL